MMAADRVFEEVLSRLDDLRDEVQDMREEGEHDLRQVLHYIDKASSDIYGILQPMKKKDHE